jgi:hypothetical membrane protein
MKFNRWILLMIVMVLLVATGCYHANHYHWHRW